MSDSPRPSRTVSLSLPAEEHWTLHHVLLDRIESETTDAAGDDPPPIGVFEAFDALDAGETRFTAAQLEAMRDVLAAYHHSTTWWEIERPRVESLLDRITDAIDRQRTTRAE